MAIPIYSNVDIHGDSKIRGDLEVNGNTTISQLDSTKLHLCTSTHNTDAAFVPIIGTDPTYMYNLTLQFFIGPDPNNAQDTSLMLKVSNPANLLYTIERMSCTVADPSKTLTDSGTTTLLNKTVQQQTDELEKIFVVGTGVQATYQILDGNVKISCQNVSVLKNHGNSPSLLQVLGKNVISPLILMEEPASLTTFFTGAASVQVEPYYHPVNLDQIKIVCKTGNNSIVNITPLCTCELDITISGGLIHDIFKITMPATYANKPCAISYLGAEYCVEISPNYVAAWDRLGFRYRESWVNLIKSI